MFVLVLFGVGLVLLAILVHFVDRHSQQFKPQSRSVLITGCDSGFGRAAALELADLGATVFAGCLIAAGAKELKSARPTAENLHPIIQDVRCEDSLTQSVKEVERIQNGKKLWAVVSNAAIEPLGTVDDLLTLETYKQHMDVNFYGAIRVWHAFRNMVKKARGRVIFVTSVRSRFAMPEGAPYTCTKYALEAFADTLRRDLAVFGVSVSMIQPGGFRTDIIRNAARDFEKHWKENVSPELREQYGEEWFQNRREMFEKRYETWQTPDITPVVKAYVHSVLAKYPKLYYWVGWDAWTFYYPLSLMPAWIQDWYFKRLTCRWGKPKGAVC